MSIYDVQDNSFGGDAELITLSCNNLAMKTKLGNTVPVAALTWCLPARFAQFPSVDDSTFCTAK
jgi:hypothetical protein